MTFSFCGIKIVGKHTISAKHTVWSQFLPQNGISICTNYSRGLNNKLVDILELFLNNLKKNNCSCSGFDVTQKIGSFRVVKESFMSMQARELIEWRKEEIKGHERAGHVVPCFSA